MITAERLQTLTTFTPKALSVALAQSGYTGCAFETAEFVGITNAGQFCYKVTYFDEAGTGEIETDKVFLTYHSDVGYVTADF
jgi:hypothetical protein